MPVIVGGTFLAYSYVREFNRAYGTKRAIVVLSEPIKMLTESRFTDCRIVAGSHDPEILLETLKSIANELAEKTPDAIPLLLGCDDRHALFFAKNKEALQTAGYVCMCNDYEMIERVSDKHNFYDLCEELDVPYAKSWYFSAGLNGPAELPVHDFPYPLILKPPDTTAFQNAEIKDKRKAYEIETPEELAEAWANIKASDYNEEMVVQDFIPGGDEALSIITTFSDPTGEVKLVSGGEVCLQDHNPAALGNPLCVIGARQEQVVENAKRIIKYLGYVGYGNFDRKYDSRRDQYCFFEINIRAGRSTYYTSLGGVNFVTPIVDQCILGKELAYREAYDPFVYCCVPDRVLKKSIEAYLCFQFSALRETMFEGIFKLEPAHYLIVDDDGIREDVRYWTPTYPIDETCSLDDFVEKIDEVMHDSVLYHNVADVEVGSFLSSGIDSSYMAACLGQINPDIKTFTVGFAEYEGDRDEISWARELADELGLANASHYIEKDEYWDALSLIQWHMDEPSGDPSAVALYFVDQLAAHDVKAVLSGEGADEFFAGYKIYQTPFANKKLSWVPKPLLRTAAKVMHKLGIRGANYLDRASTGVADWYYTNANGVAFTKAEADAVLKAPKLKRTPQEICAPVYHEASSEDQVTQMQYADLFFWLVGDILLKTDKMSMAHSLESRVPFLDREVFAISSHIPTDLRLTLEQTKIPLRKAALKNIPESWAQKEKLGFPVPIVNWLREDAYYERIKDAFTSDIAEQFFHTEKLVDILDAHKAGADNSRKIWIIYMFLLWYKAYFVDKAKPA